MSRVYISGAISNTHDYMERFARAEEKLAFLGYEVVNPARINAELPQLTWDEYMRMSITELSLCDTIYVLKNSRNSLGVQREIGYALGAGMRIIEE